MATTGYFKTTKYADGRVVAQRFFFFDGSDVDSVRSAYHAACDNASAIGKGVDAISAWAAPEVGPGASVPQIGGGRTVARLNRTSHLN